MNCNITILGKIKSSKYPAYKLLILPLNAKYKLLFLSVTIESSKSLKENNILFVEIKGSVKTIQKNLEYFKSGKIKVLFLNSNTSAAGINLQETTDIILYHKMALNNENQIIGRANRIGRNIDLNVHHLI